MVREVVMPELMRTEELGADTPVLMSFLPKVKGKFLLLKMSGEIVDELATCCVDDNEDREEG